MDVLEPTPARNVSLAIRPLEPRDGAAIWALARESETLDLNSPYAYLMWAREYGESSCLAETDGQPAGFVMGLRPPQRPDTLFVWQVAVAHDRRGKGLARRMVTELARSMGARYVEATVTPSNHASAALFRGLAQRLGSPCTEQTYLPADAFPVTDHEEEVLFRIGPLNTSLNP